MRPWLLLGLAVLGVVLTASLGRWQLRRADDKLALRAQVEAQAQLPPLSAAELGVSPPSGRRVRLRGQWLAERSVFLDNRPMEGRAGFFVVTPLRLAGGATVLVQRGWLPRDATDRTRLAPFQTPSGEVEVAGRVAPTVSQAYALGGAGTGTIRQNLDPAAFAAELGLALLPGTVVQTEGPDDGLLRHWPAPDDGLQKHYGYAFQWFALCALILGLYVWFQLLRPKLQRA